MTWKTGRPSKIIYTREESQIASSPRHEMEVHVRAGADEAGRIRAIDVYTLLIQELSENMARQP